jgi:hypothetical protein
MRVLKKISIIGLLLSAVFFLGACGGGSSSSPTAVNPTGSGSVTLDPVTKIITGSFTTANITGTAAHIHDGNVGVAGPVVVPLTQSVAGTWTVPANTVLTDAQILRLQAGGYYVNIHTTLNPGGEIRGQLVVSGTNANLFNATITLPQEVPTPTAPAGSSY